MSFLLFIDIANFKMRKQWREETENPHQLQCSDPSDDDNDDCAETFHTQMSYSM
jgi:hypothetical protein